MCACWKRQARRLRGCIERICQELWNHADNASDKKDPKIKELLHEEIRVAVFLCGKSRYVCLAKKEKIKRKTDIYFVSQELGGKNEYTREMESYPRIRKKGCSSEL